MPQGSLKKKAKSARAQLKQKGGKRVAPTSRVTKIGAPKKAPKKGSALQGFKEEKEVSKAINKRNEERAATLAQRSSHTHLLKNKDLKANAEEPNQ